MPSYTRIHIVEKPSDPAAEDMRNGLPPDVSLSFGDNLPAGIQILVAGRPTQSQLEGQTQLEVVVIPWAGIAPETRRLLQEYPDLKVYNLHHNAAPTAETALALLLAAAKRILPNDQALRRNDWRPRYDSERNILLEGKTALVLGLGAIGERIARFCLALGMHVIGVRKHAQRGFSGEEQVEVYSITELPELLPRAQILIIALPATPETEGLIGSAELHRMPPGGILVNIGRGAIVDQKALYEALCDHHLAAAGLDVWYHYPMSEQERENTPPADYPFHELENVVMSPHRGGGSDATELMNLEHLISLLQTLLRGEEPDSRVNLQLGY